MRACVRVLRTYGEDHVFVRYSNQSINRPCFFSRDRFSLLSLFSFLFFLRLYLRVGTTYLTDWLVWLVGWLGTRRRKREGKRERERSRQEYSSSHILYSVSFAIRNI